jgi:diguanylate cyclase (GGDEF)-like protein
MNGAPTELHSQLHERVFRAVNSLHRNAFMLVNDQLVIDWASDGITSLCGHSPEFLAGRSAIDFLHPDDAPIVAEIVAADLQPGSRHRDLGHRPTLDIRLAHANGTWVTLSVHSTHALDDPQIKALIVHLVPPDQLRDITSGVMAASAGAPIEESLSHLIRSIGLGNADDPTAVLVDGDGFVKAHTPGLHPRFDVPFDFPAFDFHSFGQSGTCWSTPIIGPLSGRRIGSVVASIPLHHAPPFDVRAAIDVAVHAGTLIEGFEHQRELERAATTDQLTGLWNRSRFLGEIARWPETDTNRYIVYVDLDDFKLVNDAHGHQFGDELLTIVAQRLRDAVRENDLVARLGGDEFAVVIASSTDQDEVLNRLRTSVTGEPVLIRGQRIAIEASFGIACPVDDPLAALHLADRAMYVDKRSRRSQRAS